MIGNDKNKVIRTFDLKGSLHGRYEKISNEQLENGSGLITLKDQNFLNLNSSAATNKIVVAE